MRFKQVIALIIVMGFFSNLFGQIKNDNKLVNRSLKLTVDYDFGQTSKIISEKVTSEIIINTMQSIEWNEFHIVQLLDDNGNALHVSGSLADDGLSSGFVTEDDHILKVNPPETVEEMTIILLDFLKGEDFWQNKYEYN
jgi:hypothetical protein